MLFEKLFNSLKGNQINETEKTDSVKKEASTSSISAPSVQYVHSSRNREKIIDNDNNALVLWWISKKKKGYDKTSNKFPKWFSTQYGIDFNKVMTNYIRKGLLSDNENIVKITPKGLEHLQELDYVIYVYEHPQYCLGIDDFKNAPNLHKVPNSDIVWGILNARSIECTQKAMWESLAANYGNMAHFLVDEKKYDHAIEFVFAVAYTETSGMRDNNELTAIMAAPAKRGWKNKYLPNGMPDIFLLEINNYYVTAPFKKAQEYLKLEWEEIKKRFLNSAHIKSLESTLPFRYFEKEQSFEIFKQAIEADGEKGIFSLSKCNKKLKWNNPDEHSKKYFYASVENQVKQRLGK